MEFIQGFRAGFETEFSECCLNNNVPEHMLRIHKKALRRYNTPCPYCFLEKADLVIEPDGTKHW